MNETKTVRDLLPEPPPPSERATGAAFRALQDEIAGRGGARRTRRLPFGRLQLALTGLVAAGAAATVAVAALGGGGTVAPQPGADGSARSILLAAAEQAAQEPEGRYWRVQTIDGQAYRVGKGAGGYTILGHQSQWDRWTARSTSDTDVHYARDLGAKPLTLADKAAWLKAGSPATMRVWSDDRWTTLSTVPGRTPGARSGGWTADKTDPARKKLMNKKRDERCARPGDPSLRWSCHARKQAPGDWLHTAEDPKQVKAVLGTGDAGGRLMAGYDFLTHRPATPKVRAAAFRALADVSGVRSIGEVTDDRGRTGIGLAARGTAAGTVYDYQLILKPGTYELLAGRRVVVKPGGKMAGMRPGDVLSRELVLSAGWTDKSPRHP
ncbi:hypothetical protein [Spirillospora sp. NPDC029432]|uniref:hypothetical protein n=1 Tax=Spirillospora sp. NPDC029432 TaxID=3154599 RepID=UPI003454705B